MVSPVSVKNNCDTIVFVSVIFSIFACHLISISFMEQAYTKIKQSLTTPFVYLKTFKDRVFFAVGMFVYLNLFLILFNPFNIYNWLGYLINLSPLKRLSLIGFVLVCAILIGVSQYLQYRYFRNREMKVYHLLVGFGFDVLLGTLILGSLYTTPSDFFIGEFLESFRIIFLSLALWYLISLTVLTLYNVSKEKNVIPVIRENMPVIQYECINICDENDQLRLSIKPKDLLYFESSDNYIVVYYHKDNRIKKELVRNSLKNIEQDMQKYNCIRCHRSYIINLLNVSSIKKNGRSYEINMEGNNVPIPISRGYVETVKELLVRK